MGEVFVGWRRKIGCVTLMMALVFMGGWLRSLTGIDSVTFYSQNPTIVSVSSVQGRFEFEMMQDTEPHGTMMFPVWWTTEEDVGHLPFLVALNDGDPDINWEWQRYGFGGGSIAAPPGETPLAFLVVPYWSITIPLTALSAFLLISKPKTSNQKKTAPPAPNDGGAAR